MDVDVPCPHCGTVFTIKRELLGKRTKCTNCGNAFVLSPASTPHAPPTPKSAPPEAFELPSSLFPERHSTIPPTQPASDAPFQPELQIAAKPPRTAAPNYVAPSTPPQQRFAALKIVARLYEILAGLAAAVAALSVLMLLISLFGSERPVASQLVASLIEIVSMLGAALTCLFIAQAIRLGLQIEEHTRATHTACRELADHLCAVETER